MNRPPHISAAIAAMLTRAAKQKSDLAYLEVMEITHYIARLERLLREAQGPPAPSIVDRMVAWWNRLEL
jgi:hypothetical protein